MWFGAPDKDDDADGTRDANDAGGAPAPRAQRPLVLVADDDAAVREALAILLEDEGYAVELAEDGQRALEAISRARPDLIILDLMMPVLNGWDVWDHLQVSAELSAIPVIVFTATGLRQGSVGSATVLSKTTDAATLVATIAQHLRAD